MQRKMNGPMGEKINFVKKTWITPQREIWSGSDGSQSEEKSDQGATDPTALENQGGR